MSTDNDRIKKAVDERKAREQPEQDRAADERWGTPAAVIQAELQALRQRLQQRGHDDARGPINGCRSGGFDECVTTGIMGSGESG